MRREKDVLARGAKEKGQGEIRLDSSVRDVNIGRKIKREDCSSAGSSRSMEIHAADRSRGCTLKNVFSRGIRVSPRNVAVGG